MIRYCPRCWAENAYEAAYCVTCAADLRQPEPGDRVDRLIASLAHPVPDLRRMVAWLLGKTRDPRALQALAAGAQRAVDEKDWALLDGIVQGLAEFHSAETAPALTFIARHGPVGARSAAAEALAALREVEHG